MTKTTHHRWAISSIRTWTLAAVQLPENHGCTLEDVANDLPPWARASLTYDVDGVLMLEVRCLQPHRSPTGIVVDLSDQLSALGWTATANGPMPHVREVSVVICPGAWVTYAKQEDDNAQHP